MEWYRAFSPLPVDRREHLNWLKILLPADPLSLWTHYVGVQGEEFLALGLLLHFMPAFAHRVTEDQLLADPLGLRLNDLLPESHRPIDLYFHLRPRLYLAVLA